MEPLKLIYDGYEIEIRSGGIDTMPIVSMKKIVTNIPESDTIKLPRTIEYPNPPTWWENPPMWWYEPTVTTPVKGGTVYETTNTSELEHYIRES